MTTPDGSLEAQVRRVFRESVLLTPAEQAYCDALLARIRLVEVEAALGAEVRTSWGDGTNFVITVGATT